MKKLVTKLFLLIVLGLLMMTGVFAGGWEYKVIEPAEGYYLASAVTYQEGFDEPFESLQYDYTFDENGRVTIKNRDVSYIVMKDPTTGETTWTHNTYVEEYYYDENDDCVKQIDPNGVTEYIYDSEHRIVQSTNPWGDVSEYVYDEEGRLIKIASFGASIYQFFEYDEAGRLVMEGYADAETDEPIEDFLLRKYDYDENGNLVFEDWGHSYLECRYNADGQMIAYEQTFPNGGEYGEDVVYHLEYTYDENGNNTQIDAYFGWNENGDYEGKEIFIFDYEYHGPIQEENVNPFNDVDEDRYYFEPVLWAVENEITKGVTDTTFAPDKDCTRGQVVTFLWRAAGSPEPESTECNFTDVRKGAYYYKAMLWAVENGITMGKSDTTFAPDDTCTRSEVVTFLWRAAEKPGYENEENPFADVASGRFYYNPVLWAVENGITKGITATAFKPEETCNRGQVVTFLYRLYK